MIMYHQFDSFWEKICIFLYALSFTKMPVCNTLLTRQDNLGRHFRDTIRVYNTAFSLASTKVLFGAFPREWSMNQSALEKSP